MMKRLLVLLFSLSLYAQNTAIYPGRAITINDLTVALNNFRTQLTADISNVTPTLPVFSTHGAVVPVILYIDAQTTFAEEVKCTGLTTNSFTGCTRGFDNTTKSAHGSTATVINDVAPFYPNQENAELVAIETDLIAHTWWPNALTPSAARAALGIPTFFTATLPILYDSSTGIISCPTCGSSGGSGTVTGPSSSQDGFIPQWFGTSGTVLEQGLGLVTTVGSPGSNTNLATEAAVRAAITAGTSGITGPGTTVVGLIPRWANTVGTSVDGGLPVSATPGASTVIESNGSSQIAIGWIPTTGNGSTVCSVTGSATNLHIVVFDANGNCTASVATIDSNGNLNTGGTGTSGITLGTPITFSALNVLSPVAGTVKRCSDCSVTSPCTGSGGGAYVFDSGSAHNCPF